MSGSLKLAPFVTVESALGACAPVLASADSALLSRADDIRTQCAWKTRLDTNFAGEGVEKRGKLLNDFSMA
jgi:hypothetical protein